MTNVGHLERAIETRVTHVTYRADPYCDMILVDGVSLFCEDLQTDPGDVVMVSPNLG